MHIIQHQPLTTATTIGGMLPLWLSHDPMFETMVVSIIFGLAFATLLTLVLVPVLYSLFFRVDFKQYEYSLIKFLSVVFGFILLSGCQSTSSLSIDQTSCTEPRPEMCTMDYQPVCGFDKSNNSKTYSNACTACSNKHVVNYIKGECSVLL
ncbi:MAG: hypothetical protein KAI44_04550 [Methylococcales bacterium]|nr:hypothetical protein [Methylococcales bacterium]